jgi:hypothetical protein
MDRVEVPGSLSGLANMVFGEVHRPLMRIADLGVMYRCVTPFRYRICKLAHDYSLVVAMKNLFICTVFPEIPNVKGYLI